MPALLPDYTLESQLNEVNITIIRRHGRENVAMFAGTAVQQTSTEPIRQALNGLRSCCTNKQLRAAWSMFKGMVAIRFMDQQVQPASLPSATVQLSRDASTGADLLKASGINYQTCLLEHADVSSSSCRPNLDYGLLLTCVLPAAAAWTSSSQASAAFQSHTLGTPCGRTANSR